MEPSFTRFSAAGELALPAAGIAHWIFVEQGRLAECVDDAELVLEAGDAVFHPARAIRCGAMARRPVRVTVVELSPELVAFAPSQSIHTIDAALDGVPHRIVLELRRHGLARPLVLRGLVLQLLGVARNGSEHEAAPAWVHRARGFIDVHYRERPCLEDVASAAGVPPARLRAGLVRWCGDTFVGLLRQRRIAAALQLLDSGRPLGEIASACGFCDQSHFARAFRVVHGISPSRYRRGSE